MLKLRKVEKLLFFLTILFLPTQLGRHFWPQFSFVYSLPIDYLSPTLYFWDILVLGLWAIFLISKGHINRAALIFFYGFLLIQAISLVFNPKAVGAGLVRLEQYTIAGLFGVYMASSKFKVQSSKLYFPLSLAILGESVLAIIQFLKGGSLGFWILGERTFSLSTPAIAKFDFYGYEFLRPYATFPHPNVLAGFLVVAILLLSLNNYLYGSLIRSGMTRMSIIVAAITILLTVSRTAIAFGLVSAFLLFKNGRWRLLLAIILLLPILYTRFASLVNFDHLTLLRREELSQVAFKLWLKQPLFGVGLNNFIPQGSDFLLGGPSRFLQPVHNIFLLALAETGILGLLGLLGLIGYPIIKCKGKSAKGKVLLLTWAVIIFLGLFDHYFLTLPQGYRLLFLVWGLSLSMLELKDARPS